MYSLFAYTMHVWFLQFLTLALFHISDVRNRYAEKSWDVFNKFLQQTQPLNGRFHKTPSMYPISDLTLLLLLIGGKLGFYYKEHEILPPLPGGCLTCPLLNHLY